MNYINDTDYYDPIKAKEDDIRIAKSNEKLWSEAKEFTQSTLGCEEDVINKLYIENPESWWAPYHFWGMVSFRNELRNNGFGEKEFGIQNLDNIYTLLIEESFNLKEI